MTLSAHLPVLTILAPLVGALMSVVLPRYAKPAALAFGVLTTAGAVLLAMEVVQAGSMRYALGGWAAPLGIELNVGAVGSLLFAFGSITFLGCLLVTASAASFVAA